MIPDDRLRFKCNIPVVEIPSLYDQKAKICIISGDDARFYWATDASIRTSKSYSELSSPHHTAVIFVPALHPETYKQKSNLPPGTNPSDQNLKNLKELLNESNWDAVIEFRPVVFDGQETYLVVVASDVAQNPTPQVMDLSGLLSDYYVPIDADKFDKIGLKHKGHNVFVAREDTGYFRIASQFKSITLAHVLSAQPNIEEITEKYHQIQRRIIAYFETLHMTSRPARI